MGLQTKAACSVSMWLGEAFDLSITPDTGKAFVLIQDIRTNTSVLDISLDFISSAWEWLVLQASWMGFYCVCSTTARCFTCMVLLWH